MQVTRTFDKDLFMLLNENDLDLGLLGHVIGYNKDIVLKSLLLVSVIMRDGLWFQFGLILQIMSYLNQFNKYKYQIN